MYARKVEGREITLTVSGWLWKRSLVMRDEETDTMWSHILGKAMKGRLAGAELELVPGDLTDWKTWRERHPETTVLNMSRTARNFVLEMQKRPGKFVLGIHRLGKQAKAYPYEILSTENIVNDRVGDTPVLVVFDAESTSARVFSREADGKARTFSMAANGQLKDAESGSLWALPSGACIAGPQKGSVLKPMVGIPSFRKAWFAFFPDSAEYGK